MKKVLLISALLVTIASPAIAGWRKLGNGYSGEAFYYNTQYKRINNIVEYSYKTVMPYVDAYGVKSATFKMQGDCFLRQARTVSATVYDATGKRLDTQHYDQPMQVVLTGTNEEALLGSVCQ